ncbi:hypothetical protein [Streptomyces sp. NPDC006879]|uniref:hypothetical protein n=1 Tax=Streptomyces sp. NPDC006879 TaxID=3364767 RepID=UPI0036CD233B
MAKPGYGKQPAPDQQPRRADDFAHLPPREASIASYLDRLPAGADISVKTLAKVLADYGQCAVRTALRRLCEAGHLRRLTEVYLDDNEARWVTRTYFSRTPRDEAWWAAFTRGEEPATPEPVSPAPATVPAPPSEAYAVLASVGRSDPRMTLSAADCTELAPLVGEWLARGALKAEVLRALTCGLPTPVHHPAGLARRRLMTKMPPHRPGPVARLPSATPALRFTACLFCDAPGRHEDFVNGLCRPCNEGPLPAEGLTPAEVRAHAERVRAAAGFS